MLEDYRKKESDIVYRMKLKNSTTKQKKEVIFYILMELQSSVDRTMPYRLLMYMVQIWKQELTSVKPEEANKKGFKLPAIVPIVLYNGASKWDAVLRFKDLQNESERFGEYLVDFQYILISTNDYSEKDLLKVSNAISCIIMMDQKIVKRNKNAMIRRLNKIVAIQDKLPAEKIDLLYEWLVEVLMKRFPEREAQEIIQGLKEAKNMNYAIERLFDELVEEGIEKGREEGIEKGIEKGEMKKAIETAKAALMKGIPKDVIADITGLKIEQVEKIQKECVH